eukprot:9315314-Alexandrium_andersonii.AAC.1
MCARVPVGLPECGVGPPGLAVSWGVWGCSVSQLTAQAWHFRGPIVRGNLIGVLCMCARAGCISGVSVLRFSPRPEPGSK